MTPEPQIQLIKPAGKPWFKKVWFISLAILLVLWFGIPLALKLFGLSGDEQIVLKNSETNTVAPTVPRATLETADDPWQGSPVAPVVVVEFGDFQCPFCKAAAPILKQVLKKYPEAVKLIYRDFPVVSLHPEAVAAAEAANCAAKQGKFWQYHDALFDRQDELGNDFYLTLAKSFKLNEDDFNNCLSQHQTLSEIQADLSAGVEAGVTGTPTWFVNGRKLQGVIKIEDWEKIIDYFILNEFNQKGSK